MTGLRRPSGKNLRIRRRFLLVTWLLVAAVLIARAVEVQLVERAAWAAEALAQHETSKVVPAARGRILDRNGVELAVSHMRAAVGIAPREIMDRELVVAALVEHLGVRTATARRVSGGTGTWNVVPGRYSMTQVEGLRGLKGVYVEDEPSRLYPRDGLARGLLGVVQDGVGMGGIEQSMDSVLAGQTGREIVGRDSRGREVPGQVVVVQPPVAGRDVVLTIDQDLQAIAEEMLSAAIDSTGARGGDLVITDPVTGEILALTSVVDGSNAALSAVNTTYEPGSTIKPFTAAALLRHRVAELSDSVDTEDGSWRIHGRRISDIGGGGWLTLRDVIRESSNVGMAKFAGLMSRGQQYTTLRDFGFGTPTGVPLPGEASGVLRRPEQWSLLSNHSLSYGYELAVTPLQMAMAFGALANDGLLMEPILIREVRDHDGTPARYGRPRPVRHAVPPGVTEALTPVLVNVVEEGTGTRARMSSFRLAGKSGTTRAIGAGGRYEHKQGAYYASFGASFPADDPQLLVFVRLDRPQGDYYGGQTAAPVARATIESLLAARQAPIDRGALALAARHVPPPSSPAPLVRFAAAIGDAPPDPWPAAADPQSRGAGSARMTVPLLEGASIRVALRRLHKLGLRVRLEGGGVVRATVPGAGAGIVPGDTVRVLTREHSPPAPARARTVNVVAAGDGPGTRADRTGG
ncbi:MAG: penicillin-binding transpeptidase domain-containing protein [Gemmatimonadota bacterium]|nr:penicillin-binding transpeptidase domain-containing protein [Gemmatimonadota bacterium]